MRVKGGLIRATKRPTGLTQIPAARVANDSAFSLENYGGKSMTKRSERTTDAGTRGK